MCALSQQAKLGSSHGRGTSLSLGRGRAFLALRPTKAMNPSEGHFSLTTALPQVLQLSKRHSHQANPSFPNSVFRLDWTLIYTYLMF